ncbi:hypothetical protein PIROE2DRAFT_18802 [Piromyces sp. E2]|nr:hypothetical protein PIROE2DRAFT_18802 [Piromyces sp. E2]|eukprot:OUM56547.1 hypothetical protein PIROE2DRAFT_18802 [Piromyces sp. E2]
MKVIHLLLSFLIVFALQWESYLFVNAKVPKDIYFPQNDKGYTLVTVDNKTHYLYLAPQNSGINSRLSSCRYNQNNKAVYCEFRNDGLFRVKFFVDSLTTNCNFDEKYLKNKNQFSKVVTFDERMKSIYNDGIEYYTFDSFTVSTKKCTTTFMLSLFIMTKIED